MEDDKADDIQEDATEITEESATSDDTTSTTDDTKEIVDTDEEPPVRKSAKDYIIERKDRKIAKLQEGETDGAEEKTDDTRSVIREEISRAFEPIKKSLVQSEDEKELQAAFEKYPEAKKMEKTVRRYMTAYGNVPVEFVIRGLLGDRSVKKQEADDAAAATRQGGHTRRPADAKLPDFAKMTDEEFAEWDRKQH